MDFRANGKRKRRNKSKVLPQPQILWDAGANVPVPQREAGFFLGILGASPMVETTFVVGTPMGQAQETEGERDPGCWTLYLSEPLPRLPAPWDSEPSSWGEAEAEEGGGAAASRAGCSLLAPTFWRCCLSGSCMAVRVLSRHPALIKAGQPGGPAPSQLAPEVTRHLC